VFTENENSNSLVVMVPTISDSVTSSDRDVRLVRVRERSSSVEDLVRSEITSEGSRAEKKDDEGKMEKKGDREVESVTVANTSKMVEVEAHSKWP